MERIDYTLIKSDKVDFREAIYQLVGKIKQNCVRLCFFIDASSSHDYVEKKMIVSAAISNVFAERVPTWSVISQKPLDCSVVLEIQYAVDCTIIYKSKYIILESEFAKELIMSGVCGDISNSIFDQSESSFQEIERVFKCEGFEFCNVIRQWNYIERIVAIDDNHQHYQDFNDVRSRHYSKQNWRDGYPAATGIGTQFGGVVIDLDAVIIKSDDVQIRKIDNDLQVAAHAYSKEVLIGEECCKTTPKFERAKSISSLEDNRVYISGTAAILGEESLVGVDFKRQIEATMLNIENLICERTLVNSNIRTPSPMRLDMLRVYLKYEQDVESAIEYMRSNYGEIPACYLLGDVCRDELLVEIEGIAYKI